MRKNENISRFSADKIRRKVARGESRTDWKRVKAMSRTEVERLADRDEGPLPDDWESWVTVGLPPAKQDIHIRLDGDILEWFKAHGRGYQTRINAVLRAFVEAQKPRGWSPASGVSSEPRIRLNQRAKHQRAERQ